MQFSLWPATFSSLSPLHSLHRKVPPWRHALHTGQDHHHYQYQDHRHHHHHHPAHHHYHHQVAIMWDNGLLILQMFNTIPFLRWITITYLRRQDHHHQHNHHHHHLKHRRYHHHHQVENDYNTPVSLKRSLSDPEIYFPSAVR